MAGLPDCLPGFHFPTVRIAIYADDIVLWSIGSSRRTVAVRSRWQMSLDRAAPYLQEVGLTLCTNKAAIFLYRPRRRLLPTRSRIFLNPSTHPSKGFVPLCT